MGSRNREYVSSELIFNRILWSADGQSRTGVSRALLGHQLGLKTCRRTGQ